MPETTLTARRPLPSWRARPVCRAAVIIGSLPGLAIAQAAAGQADAAPPGWSGTFGPAMMVGPSHEGSPNRRLVAGPELTLTWQSPGAGRIELDRQGLIWMPSALTPIGLIAAIDPGRLDHTPTRLNPTPGDDRLAGLGRVEGSLEVGAIARFGQLVLQARRALGPDGHAGWQLETAVRGRIALGERLGLNLEAGNAWADRHYMQTYFGITPAQSAASGWRTYTPRAGWHRYTLSLGADYALAPRWQAQITWIGSRLAREAADSPLTARRHGSSVIAGVAREF